MTDHRPRSALRRRLLIFLALATPIAGCPDPVQPDSDGDGIPDPTAPAWLEIAQALGIWQEIQRVSRTLPPHLDDVPGLDGQGPFEVETIADVPFRETSVRTLTVNVHRPKTDDQKLRRAVVLYAGAGFVVEADFLAIETWADYLASHGFVAFNARPPLLAEPGVEIRDVISDALAAVRFVAWGGPHFGADPQRIGVLGHSSGRVLALVAGMHPDPDSFREPGDPDAPVEIRAIVDIFAPTDYARLATGSDPSLLPPSDYLVIHGGTPGQVPEAYALTSAVRYVRPGLPPTLIVHGHLDTTIPIGQSIRLADLLEANGNVVVREFQADTGHVLGWGLFNNDGFGRAMVRIVRFFEEHL